MRGDNQDIRRRLGLRPVINVSGTMTALGASIVVPEAIEAMAEILPEFVEMSDLHAKASAVIARLTGAEAGTVTASTSSGVTVAVAACMTGDDRAKIERLPDATGMKDEVVIQLGHMVNYGAPLDQAIRLAGARVVPVGQATDVRDYQLEGALGDRTAAAVYVVSHHTVQYGHIPLAEFARICHGRDVPVIVDAASEYDLRGFLAAGADLAVYSAHKFLGGPTAGLIAGSLPLVRATYLQNFGIGRGMKVGKESIVGAMATLEAWEARDHAVVRARETGYLELWRTRFTGRPGLRVEILPDPTDNPLDRLHVHIDPGEAKIAAWELARALAAGDPPVIVRDHDVEHGYVVLDPCNLHPGEAEIVAERILAELDGAVSGPTPASMSLEDCRKEAKEQPLSWPYRSG